MVEAASWTWSHTPGRPCRAGRAGRPGPGQEAPPSHSCSATTPVEPGGAAESGSIKPGEEAWLSPRAHVQVGGNPASAPGPKGRPLVVLLVALTSPKGDFGVRAGS